MERAIETQRLRLLRFVAGLVVALRVLSVGPVSRGFAAWACCYVGSILVRAEAAARYLVIAKARRMAARNGFAVDRGEFGLSATPEFAACETDLSLCDVRGRLDALRAVLMDLPRHALRLLRRIEKRMRRTVYASQAMPRPDTRLPETLRDWRLAGLRIERPPDRESTVSSISRDTMAFLSPPSGFRAGGNGGFAFS